MPDEVAEDNLNKEWEQFNRLAEGELQQIFGMTDEEPAKFKGGGKQPEFVMKKLPSLRHLGSFSGWNMSDMRKRQARRFPVTKNLDISIDSETIPRPSEFAGKFSKITLEIS